MGLQLSRIFPLVALALGVTGLTVALLLPDILAYASLSNVTLSVLAALGTALAGWALLSPPKQQRVRYALTGICCALMGGLSLALPLFLTLPQAIDDPAPFWMHPQAAASFILCGLCLFLLPRLQNRLTHGLFLGSLLLMIVMALMAALGFAVKMNLLYSWYDSTRMALPAACGLLLIGMSLWLRWYEQAKAADYLSRAEDQISVSGTAIIVGVSLTVFLAVFSLLSAKLERTLEASLRENYMTESALIKSEIRDAVGGAVPFTRRIQLNRYLPRLNGGEDAQAVRIIEEEVRSFIGSNYIYAAVYNAAGTRIAQAGKSWAKPELRMPIGGGGGASQRELLWQDGLRLRMHIDIVQRGKRIGEAVIERRLPSIAALVTMTNTLGATAETRICTALSDTHKSCLPSLLHPEAMMHVPRLQEKHSLAMHLALDGERDIRIASDYSQERVIAAYGPIEGTGLGLVVKIDTDEFYGPLRETFEMGLLLMLALCGVGVAILRKQMMPHVNRLAESQREATLEKARVDAVMDASRHAIFAMDSDGVMTLFNRGAERMLQYRAAEAIGQLNLLALIDESELAARRERLQASLARTMTPWEVMTAPLEGMDLFVSECTFRRKNGEALPVELSLTALYDDNGRIMGYMGIAQDITARKEVEAMKNEFISVVSHELRTPLTSIRGSLGLIAGGAVGEIPEKAGQLLEIAYKNSERLVRLINDILDIEKIESGKVQLSLRPIQLDALLRQVIRENEGFADKYQVRLALQADAANARILADSDRMNQVFTNLISNAVKFSPQGGEVRIVLQRENQNLQVRVIDQGPGIPEEFRSRIFGKFAQADSSSTRAKGGTGLGLSITRHLVEAMGGQIGFDTELDLGTEFYVILPELIEQAEEGMVCAIVPPAVKGRGRILICEDDADIATLLQMLLERQGYDSVVAPTAQAAKTLLEQHAFDAMTLDLNLPDQDGIALIRELRAGQQFAHLPIVVISAFAEEGKRALNGDAVGILDWLPKPIAPERLVQTLGSVPTLCGKPRILHVEDDRDIAGILALPLQSIADIRPATTLAEAQAALATEPFDLVILDILLPDGNGLDLLPSINQRAIPVVILSSTEVSAEVRDRVLASIVKSVVTEDKIIDRITALIEGRRAA